MPRRVGILASVVLAASSLVAVGSAQASAPPPRVSPPASMAAAGDSFTRGFATGSPDCNFFGTCSQYSWSTGTAVNSHYQRLLALNPALAGNATNAAAPGSPIAGLVSQVATFAGSQPDYVTVLLGGGDICFGTTTPAQFATRFRAGMDALFAASPNSRVLVASIFNLESLRAAVLQRSPGYVWSFCGPSFFNASDADRALQSSRLEAFNGILASECATYVNCLFDGNALFDHVWTPGEVSTVDNVHPSAAGQEMIAEVLYDAGYRWDPCKNGEWTTARDNVGRSFKNQGDCVSFVASKGANTASG